MKYKGLSTIAAAAFLPLVASAYDITTMSWDDIEQQAKKEGKVTFAVWYLQPAFREYVKTFEDETGIKVYIPEGTFDGNTTKLLAETKRKKGSMDVVAIGASKLKLFDAPSQFVNFNVLPDYAKLNTRLQGIESNGYAVGFWGNQTGLAYDPTRIDETALPQSFEELTAYIQANPKSFGVNDPNGGGGGGRFIQSTLQHFAPSDYTQEASEAVMKDWSRAWKWFHDNRNNMIITASNADSLTRINDGEIVIAPAWEDHLAGLQKRGAIAERIKFYIPEFGMSGGGNFVVVPKNAKNLAASVYFVDWLTSPKTQSGLNAKFGSAPQHPDANAEAALVNASMRQNSTDSFGEEYDVESRKRFTREVLMK
ncbi:extracellular solute-binding protein [Grimontia sp. NTOU-MAR1]|uniref:extracellular solute-binding protein n=1 Tax=Grimontia sp. NTOU-MAR1 TaxID=3111011 RepID=UPI002DBA79B2|nr:extracellular solute-binding protein [Grimontia sp. NTOU-MAR1]WRW00968.1 extracellular solute-binding protein [Grimontia sp. NTOU-MAR1]